VLALLSGQHRDRVRELVSTLKPHGAFKWLVDTFFDAKDTPSVDFRAAVAMLSLRLEAAFEDATPLTGGDTWCIIPSRWDTKAESTVLEEARSTEIK